MYDLLNNWPSQKKRNISEFVCKELLYDYINNTLDEDRKKAVEEKLLNHPQLQHEFKKIQVTLKDLKSLKKLELNTDLILEVQNRSNLWFIFLNQLKYQSWPIGLKWGLEALSVVALMILVLTFSPWKELLKKAGVVEPTNITIAEATRSEQIKEEGTSPAEFQDDSILPKTNTEKINPEIVVQPVTNEKKAESSAAVTDGFLFRGTLKVSNLDVTTIKIKDYIESLGGRKAGEVALGWKKTEETSYFHFTLPEAKKADLEIFLNQYGPLKLAKEKHPRIMPQGIIRLIITLEEAD